MIKTGISPDWQHRHQVALQLEGLPLTLVKHILRTTFLNNITSGID